MLTVETLVSATELARKLGEYLARVRYRGESFVVEKNGKRVARVIPATAPEAVSVSRALAAWSAAGTGDSGFADDLERVGAADRAPENPWDS
jgi:prevent-host-death family protein